MKWYYSKSGTQLGPVEQDELISKIASSEVSPTDLVWKDGMGDWMPVSRINELSAAIRLSVAPEPQNVSPPAAENTMGTPYTPPMATPQAPMVYNGPAIQNYLWQSIVVTILCCWPLGIPAIVYAAKVEGLKSRGDIQGAMAASASAKTWCMVAGGAGLAALLIWAVIMGFFGAAGVSHR